MMEQDKNTRYISEIKTFVTSGGKALKEAELTEAEKNKLMKESKKNILITGENKPPAGGLVI